MKKKHLLLLITIVLNSLTVLAGERCEHLFVDTLIDEQLDQLAEQQFNLQSNGYKNKAQFQMATDFFKKNSNLFFAQHPDLIGKFRERLSVIGKLRSKQTEKILDPQRQLEMEKEIEIKKNRRDYQNWLRSELKNLQIDLSLIKVPEMLIFELINKRSYKILEVVLAQEHFNPNFDNEFGATMLTTLVSYGWSKDHSISGVLKSLLANPDLEINKGDKSHKNALHAAVLYNAHTSVIETLVKAGIDINAQEDNGFTPLHLVAARSKNLKDYMIFLSAADSTIKDLNGKTPLDILFEYNQAPVALELARLTNADLRDTRLVKLFTNNLDLFFRHSSVEDLNYLIAQPAVLRYIEDHGLKEPVQTMKFASNANFDLVWPVVSAQFTKDILLTYELRSYLTQLNQAGDLQKLNQIPELQLGQVLIAAASTGNYSLVRQLLANQEFEKDFTETIRRTAYQMAKKNGHADSAKLLKPKITIYDFVPNLMRL